jgi:hypothetical protein
MARCNLGDGRSTLFWTDLWHDSCLHQKFPHLVTYAKRTDYSVSQALQHEYLQDLFHLPMSQAAYEEFLQLEEVCSHAQNLSIQQNPDSWSYIWGSSDFCSKKAYSMMMGHYEVIPHFSWLWNSSCQPRHKFFFWLLLHDRLNTRNLLGRKNFHLQSYDCIYINCPLEETLEHLFWNCPFAEICWDFICPSRRNDLQFLEGIVDIKEKLQLPFAMDIIMLAAWGIWIVRNNKIFNNISATFQSWKAIYLQEIRLISYRMKKKHASSFKEWLQSTT